MVHLGIPVKHRQFMISLGYSTKFACRRLLTKYRLEENTGGVTKNSVAGIS